MSLPTLSWFYPNGTEISNATDITITTSQRGPLDNSTVSLLEILSLRTSLAGSYTCHAVSDLPTLGLVKSSNLEYQLIINSKYRGNNTCFATMKKYIIL